MRNIATENVADLESIETQEWLESLDYVLERKGPERVQQLLAALDGLPRTFCHHDAWRPNLFIRHRADGHDQRFR